MRRDLLNSGSYIHDSVRLPAERSLDNGRSWIVTSRNAYDCRFSSREKIAREKGGATGESRITGRGWFTTPAYATGVTIREETGGNVMQVQLRDTTGTYHTLWTGTDPTGSNSGAVDFTLQFPATAYQVNAVMVLVSTANSPSIDAIEMMSGGSASGLTLYANGFDSSGNYDETTYNSASQPIDVATFTHGVEMQTVASSYTSGYLSATVTTTVPTGNETQETFDSNGNMLTQTVGYGTADAATTTDTYDSQNRILSLTDSLGDVTTWSYTSTQTVSTDPLGNTDTKTYNGQGELVSEVNGNDLLTTYAYDSSGDVTSEVEYDGPTTSSAVNDTLTWTYNSDGTVATAGNDQGTYTYTYNAQGQVANVVTPTGVSETFGYDQNGNRDLVEDSLGGVQTSLYNSSNQLVSAVLTQDGATLREDYTYTQSGQIATETRYSDAAGTDLVATTTNTYDLYGDVTEIKTVNASSVVIDDFQYTYTNGQLTSETDTQSAVGGGSPVTTGYGYDAQGELTGAGSTGYSYDVGGNPTESGDTYNASYKNQITSDSTWNYSYDNDGNITGKLNITSGGPLSGWSWTYGYNNSNELTSTKEYNASSVLQLEVDYKYDVDGNLIETDNVTTGSVQKYVMDGWNPALSGGTGNTNFNVLAVLDVSGGNSTLASRYMDGDQVDQHLGRIDVSGGSGTGYWTLTDDLGSVRDVIANSSSATVKDAITYDAFGNMTQTGSSYLGLYSWTGRQVDAETGLQYNRARWYDSQTGRWISEDPSRFDAGDSNLYRYAMNQATEATDPSGLEITREVESQGAKTQTNINQNTPSVHINTTIGNTQFTGDLYIQTAATYSNAKTGKAEGNAVFVAYSGAQSQSKRVAFLQVFSSYLIPIYTSVVKRVDTYSALLSANQFELPTDNPDYKKITTSSFSRAQFYVDIKTKSTSNFYTDPDRRNAGNIETTGPGGWDDTNNFAWISDAPKLQDSILRNNNRPAVPAFPGKTFQGWLIEFQFTDFAIDTQTGTALGAVSWDDYRATFGLLGEMATPVELYSPMQTPYGNTSFVLDNKSHYVAFGLPGANEVASGYVRQAVVPAIPSSLKPGGQELGNVFNFRGLQQNPGVPFGVYGR
jgi:RHS repeat-associated protein